MGKDNQAAKIGLGTSSAEWTLPPTERAGGSYNECGDAALRLSLVEISHEQPTSIARERDCLGTVAPCGDRLAEGFKCA